MNKEETWEPVAMFCPNCGKKVTGFRSNTGAAKIQCDRCKCVLYSKQKLARPNHIDISVDYPIRQTI